MSIMKIGNDRLRLEYHDGENFVDVASPKGYEHYALAFSNLDTFNFYCLVRWNDNRYSKEELIVFSDKSLFNEWLKKVDVEILYLSEHDNRKPKL